METPKVVRMLSMDSAYCDGLACLDGGGNGLEKRGEIRSRSIYFGEEQLHERIDVSRCSVVCRETKCSDLAAQDAVLSDTAAIAGKHFATTHWRC